MVTDARFRKDVLVSLGILSLVIAFALTGLALDGNWPKVARVAAAYVSYSSVLLIFLRVDRDQTPRITWFVVAGAIAGLVSGLVRPNINIALIAAQMIAGAVLLAGAHWVAISRWRTLRQRIVSPTP